jgi:hypothetical protein
MVAPMLSIHVMSEVTTWFSNPGKERSYLAVSILTERILINSEKLEPCFQVYFSLCWYIYVLEHIFMMARYNVDPLLYWTYTTVCPLPLINWCFRCLEIMSLGQRPSCFFTLAWICSELFAFRNSESMALVLP